MTGFSCLFPQTIPDLFVAVDSTHRTAGRRGTTVPVAVPVPEGVRYETTVEE